MDSRYQKKKPNRLVFLLHLCTALCANGVFGQHSDVVTQLPREGPLSGLSSTCPYLLHYVPQMLSYWESRERCSRAGGSLPKREPRQVLCLKRFFENIGRTAIADHFSKGVKNNLQEFTEESKRLWFRDDDAHNQHGPRASKGDKREFVCTMTVGVLPNQCNSSLVVHYEFLSFVNAQNVCGNSYARLPLRTSKEEAECFKNYFPHMQSTWFDGRRPELGGAPLSGDRCFFDSSETDECPPHLTFVCVSERFQADVPKSSVYYSSISTSKVTVTGSDISGNDEIRSSFETTTPSRVLYDDQGFDDYREWPRDDHDREFSISLDGIEYPAKETSASIGLTFCFQQHKNLKLLDRNHPDQKFLRLLKQSGRQAANFSVMRRNQSEARFNFCPYVVVNGTESSVRRLSMGCESIALAVCEPRVCPAFKGERSGLEWSESKPNSTLTHRCDETSLGVNHGNITRTCDTTGYWEDERIECYGSKEEWFRSTLTNFTTLHDKTTFIQERLRKDKNMLDVLFKSKDEVVLDLTSNIVNPEETTREIMGGVILTAVENLEDKKGMTQVTQLARELVTALGIKLRENQSIAMEDESFGYAVSRREVNEDGVNVMHSHLRQSEITLRGRFPGTSSLTMGHIVMSNVPERVSEPNDTDPWSQAVVNTPLVEFFVSNAGSRDPGSASKIDRRDVTVELSFQHIRPKTKRSFVKCVFLKPETEYYSDEGCSYLANASDSMTSVCFCNHTTSFAALLLPSESAITHAQAKFLQYMTAIGMPLSMFCLLICIPIFTFIREQHEERNTIHRNLCISLLAGDIVLIVSSYGDHHMVCTLLGSLVHFCFLSALLWMGLEGVHIIHIMWLVFTKSGIPIVVYYVLGYGLAFIIVAGTNVAFEEPYERTAQLCFLSRDNMAILSFIVPLAVVVCVNFFAVAIVFYRMRNVKSATDKDVIKTVQKWTRGVAVLVPLLGLPWIFGLLMLANDRQLVIISAVIFNVFAVLQGPGIFLTQVWFSDKKRDSIARYLSNKGRLALFVSRIFARPRESTDSSVKSSKLSKSSTSVRGGHARNK